MYQIKAGSHHSKSVQSRETASADSFLISHRSINRRNVAALIHVGFVTIANVLSRAQMMILLPNPLLARQGYHL